MVPSTRAVPFFPRISAGRGTSPASTGPMSGRSRSQRLLAVGWLTPKMAPATSWVMLVRISATTMATDRNKPIEAGRPPGRTTSPRRSAIRAASSCSCP